MKTVHVSGDEVKVPTGVRVLQSVPDRVREYVQLYQFADGTWTSQTWFTVNGVEVGERGDNHPSQVGAVKEAFDIADDERVPFVNTVTREGDAMRVVATVE